MKDSFALAGSNSALRLCPRALDGAGAKSLIPADRLPDPAERLRLFESRFAVDRGRRGMSRWESTISPSPKDGLAVAAANETLRRNFQGYTDDQSEVLIGIGAPSSISR